QVPQGPQSDNAHCRSRAAAVQWGNQQPLFPISPRSLLLGETRLSSRIEQLAKPKDFAAFHKALYRDLHLYSCGTPRSNLAGAAGRSLGQLSASSARAQPAETAPQAGQRRAEIAQQGG
uniref:RGS domain-containing protein n=1 Tax=Macrostomum lignano TaxID=282301 RepID=A0A1I8IZD2_9PLAT